MGVCFVLRFLHEPFLTYLYLITYNVNNYVITCMVLPSFNIVNTVIATSLGFWWDADCQHITWIIPIHSIGWFWWKFNCVVLFILEDFKLFNFSHKVCKHTWSFRPRPVDFVSQLADEVRSTWTKSPGMLSNFVWEIKKLKIFHNCLLIHKL